MNQGKIRLIFQDTFDTAVCKPFLMSRSLKSYHISHINVTFLEDEESRLSNISSVYCLSLF